MKTKKQQIVGLSLFKCNFVFQTILLLSIMFSCLFAFSQQSGNSNPEESALIDQFINTVSNRSPILFDSKNLKLYWTDNSVFSKDNLINVVLERNGNGASFNSKSFPVKLANVDPTWDCKVVVVSENSDLTFSVLSSNKKLSESIKSDDFLHYSVTSSVFHLCDVDKMSFNLTFSSMKNIVKINKIAISFSPNMTSFAYSPSSLSIVSDDKLCKVKGATYNYTPDDNTFLMNGRNSSLMFGQYLSIEKKPVSISVTLKNNGTVSSRIYIGYAPYSDDLRQLNSSNYPLLQNGSPILKIISLNREANSFVVESDNPPVEKSYVAFNVKDDYSDIPNFNILPGEIKEVSKQSDNRFSVTMSKPFDTQINEGSFVRMHSDGGTYVYLTTKLLKPGEEFSCDFVLSSDSTNYAFLPNKFPVGVKFIVPLILSYSETADNNTVLIEKYDISF